MRKYRVTQLEKWIRTVEVEADSEDEAMAILEANDWTFEMDNLEHWDTETTICEEMTLVGEAYTVWATWCASNWAQERWDER